MYLLMLTYLYCELGVQGKSLGFSKRLKKCRNEVKQIEIAWIYRQAIASPAILSIAASKAAIAISSLAFLSSPFS